MNTLLRIGLVALLLLIVGGGVYLATWDIPAPKNHVEKIIPDDRFPH
jgi:hypothetical protein